MIADWLFTRSHSWKPFNSKSRDLLTRERGQDLRDLQRGSGVEWLHELPCYNLVVPMWYQDDWECSRGSTAQRPSRCHPRPPHCLPPNFFLQHSCIIYSLAVKMSPQIKVWTVTASSPQHLYESPLRPVDSITSFRTRCSRNGSPHWKMKTANYFGQKPKRRGAKSALGRIVWLTVELQIGGLFDGQRQRDVVPLLPLLGRGAAGSLAA